MTTLRLTRPEPTEAQVLKTVLRVLELHPLVGRVWRMNTGAGQLVRGKGVSQWVKFGFAGSPDIHGYMKDGRALYCEVKRPSGTVSKEQSEFIEEAVLNGCFAFVARSADDVIKHLNGLQKNKTPASLERSGALINDTQGGI